MKSQHGNKVLEFNRNFIKHIPLWILKARKGRKDIFGRNSNGRGEEGGKIMLESSRVELKANV